MTVLEDIHNHAQSYLHPGTTRWLTDLETSYILASLRFPDGSQRGIYDDDTRIRLRRHVILHGPKGVGKTTALNHFFDKLTPALHLPAPEADDQDRPLVVNLSGQGITWARLRGGCSERGRLVPPLLKDAHFILAPELLDFIGHNPMQWKDKVEALNVALEEAKLSMSLIKNFDVNEERLNEFMEQCSTSGVRYDSVRHIMQYNVTCTFAGCTRPLGDKLEEAMRASGFWSRINHSVWDPPEEQSQTVWHGGFGIRATLRETILAFNTKLWSTRWDNIQTPPPTLHYDVMDAIWKRYKKLLRSFPIPVFDLLSMRDHTDANQLLTASAAMRMVAKGEVGPRIKELVYTKEDADRAVIQAEDALEYRFNRILETIKEDEKFKPDHEVLLEFLVKNDKKDGEFHAGDFVDWVNTTRKITRQSARNQLSRIKKRGWVASELAGEYTASESMLRNAFPPEDLERNIRGDEHPDSE